MNSKKKYAQPELTVIDTVDVVVTSGDNNILEWVPASVSSLFEIQDSDCYKTD